MSAPVLIFPALLFVGLAVGAWALICNEITYRHRNRLIDGVYSSGNWQALQGLFRKVSYEQHYHALLLLRDPRLLYDQRLRRFIDLKPSSVAT